jgi:hypothetical protein
LQGGGAEYPIKVEYYEGSGNATISALTFQDNMRKLWEDHITWTRLFIISASAGLPETDATTQRLLNNQTDIGNAIKPYYGDAAGDQLTALLKDHILGAAALLTAAKAGDTAGVQAASDKWYANADDIAAFLNKANPKAWPVDTLKMDMKMHLDQTLAEAVDHLKGNYAADVADYDVVHRHILAMADALSGGIINQFPEQFGNSSAAPSMVGMPHTGGAQNPVSDMLGWALGAFGLMLVASGFWVLRKRSVRI